MSWWLSPGWLDKVAWSPAKRGEGAVSGHLLRAGTGPGLWSGSGCSKWHHCAHVPPAGDNTCGMGCDSQACPPGSGESDTKLRPEVRTRRLGSCRRSSGCEVPARRNRNQTVSEFEQKSRRWVGKTTTGTVTPRSRWLCCHVQVPVHLL